MLPPISSSSARRTAQRLGVPAACLAVSACSGDQSILAPGGPESDSIATISWVMFIGGGLILAVVMMLAFLGVVSGTGWRRTLAHPRLIVIGGIAFPLVVLTALLVFGLVLERSTIADEERITVRVTGEQWWWRVAYLDETGETIAVTANEIRIPVGQPVRFELESADVIHSFWVPALGGKIDMIPGRTNITVMEADRAGVYRGQCAEFCGEQHALMALMVVAEAETDFDAWLTTQQSPAAPPSGELARQGASLFVSQGCGACHAVRGTQAAGTIGPDLTHVGDRLTLAAGTLPNNQGTLAGWIADAQAIKPGNDMPSFDDLTGIELRALAAYLEGLR